MTMSKTTVLFLAANPLDTPRLQLDEELRAITHKIRAADYRDSLDLRSVWATRPDDMLQALNEWRPAIVHFSGHGTSSGELLLQAQDGLTQSVSVTAVAALFAALLERVRLVVFNACYSQKLAVAATATVDCAVGMNAAIGDQAAITFAASFYRALGFGAAVQKAFDQGKAALMLESIPEDATLELMARPGVDPNTLTLVAKSESSSWSEPALSARLNELVQILEARAQRINDHLADLSDDDIVQEYAERFQLLHERHIAALRRHDMILAHEVLREIYELSNEFESEGIGQRRTRTADGFLLYHIDEERLRRGLIIGGYVAGDIRKQSPRFRRKQVAMLEGLTNKGGLDLYEEILATAGPEVG